MRTHHISADRMRPQTRDAVHAEWILYIRPRPTDAMTPSTLTQRCYINDLAFHWERARMGSACAFFLCMRLLAPWNSRWRREIRCGVGSSFGVQWCVFFNTVCQLAYLKSICGAIINPSRHWCHAAYLITPAWEVVMGTRTLFLCRCDLCVSNIFA